MKERTASGRCLIFTRHGAGPAPYAITVLVWATYLSVAPAIVRADPSRPFSSPALANRSQTVEAEPSPLAVHITAPPAYFKLRQGQTTAVRVQVLPGSSALQRWRLLLVTDDGQQELLASGTDPVDDRVVATLSAGALQRGTTYYLILEGTDDQDRVIGDFTQLLVPDPLYSLIPLDSGNKSRPVYGGTSMDGSGDVVAMGAVASRGSSSGDIELVDARTGAHRVIHIPLEATGAFHLSGDGTRIVFAGGGVRPSEKPLKSFVLGFFDIATGEITQGPGPEQKFLSTDWSGKLVAFQLLSVGIQFALYDQRTDTLKQITNDPNAFQFYGACPARTGSTPLISGDGRTIAFASSATLGIAPSEGCHVFAYDVPSGTLRHVARIDYNSFDLPSISYDGHWLAYSSSPAFRDSEGALLDLTTGELTDPIAGIADYPTFDAVVTGDGKSVVLSTQGDLDPRVGNADHNMELFLYDIASGTFTQITETTGGIGDLAGGCPPYEPRVSFDGSTVMYRSTSCHGEGAQRSERDGLAFFRVRAVRRRPGNHPPSLQPLQDARILVGQSLSLPVAATDPDDDPIAFFAQVVNGHDVPGSDFADNHDGTAVFRWQPTIDQRGAYRVRFAAFDGGGDETWEDITIAACSRIVTDDDSLPGVIGALFDPDPAPCHAADLNGDGTISAADMVAAVAHPRL